MQHVDVLTAKLQASETAASEQRSLSMRLAVLEQQIKERATTAHVTRVMMRLDTLKANTEEVRARLDELCDKVDMVRYAEWLIKDLAGLKREMPAGRFKTSARFALGGIRGFMLKYYPNGCQINTYGVATEPFIVLLNDPGKVKANIELSLVGDKSVRSNDTTNWDKQGLVLPLVSLPSNIDDRDQFTVEVTLLDLFYTVMVSDSCFIGHHRRPVARLWRCFGE